MQKLVRRRGLHKLLTGTSALLALALMAAGCAGQGLSASGQGGGDVASRFSGETVTLVVANSASGTMDAYARMILPHLREALGAEEIVVDNQNGGGGLEGLNTVWGSEADGLTLGFTSVASIILSDLSGSRVQFNAQEFTYLGRAATVPRVLSVNAKGDIQDISDLMALNREFIFPIEGPESDMFIMAGLSKALGYPLKIVTGYSGMGDSMQAVISGDADGLISSVTAAKSAIKAGDLRPIALLAPGEGSSAPYLEGVPTVMDQADSEGSRKIVNSFNNMVELHRSFFAPPDASAETKRYLRKAVEEALNNAELEKKARQRGLPLVFMPGDKVQRKVTEVYDSSQSIKPILENALARLK